MCFQGSPEENKDLQIQHVQSLAASLATTSNMAALATTSNMAAMSMVTGNLAAEHFLAKPVPMRRLSEKRIAQARACMGSVPDQIAVNASALSKCIKRFIALPTTHLETSIGNEMVVNTLKPV